MTRVGGVCDVGKKLSIHEEEMVNIFERIFKVDLVVYKNEVKVFGKILQQTDFGTFPLVIYFICLSYLKCLTRWPF